MGGKRISTQWRVCLPIFSTVPEPCNACVSSLTPNAALIASRMPTLRFVSSLLRRDTRILKQTIGNRLGLLRAGMAHCTVAKMLPASLRIVRARF